MNWKINTSFGKGKILKEISENEGKTIYNILNGRVNFRVYTNIRELEESGYIRVIQEKEKSKLLYLTEIGIQKLKELT